MNISWNILSKYRNELYGISILWIMLLHGLGIKNTEVFSELKCLTKIIEHRNIGGENFFIFIWNMSILFNEK